MLKLSKWQIRLIQSYKKSRPLPPLAVGYLISLSSGGSDAGHLPLHSFIVGLSLLPVTYLISLVVSVFLFKETYCKPQKGVVVLEKTHYS
jgi:hypothetical protein